MARIIDATPEKRTYLSIISEYDLKRSICELIDNAIDLWSKHKTSKLAIQIKADARQQTISIEDNAGGIEEAKLDLIVSPGKTDNEISDDVIGYFGVGSKRAVVALAEKIAIHSRYENEKSMLVEFDDHWITEEPSWNLPYSESKKQISPRTTFIELTKLRVHLSEEEIEALGKHLAEVYANFIKKGTVINLNGKKLEPITFDAEWSYPPEFLPTLFATKIPIEDRNVTVEILSGLIDHPGDPDRSYGVFVYCNDRLVVRDLTDYSVGFVAGMVGNPHYNISLVRTIVRLKGQSRDMPWNSSKSGLDLKHPVFQSLRQSIIDITKKFAQVSRSLQGKWDVEVFPHKTGRIIKEKLETIASIPKDYLPKPPPSRLRWHQKVLKANAKLVVQKPWADGLLGSIFSLDLIYKQSFSQKNRICLIVLDSTLEIAFKEYLVNEVNIGLKAFKNIAENRVAVEKEVKKHLTINSSDAKKIGYYYKLRCDLIHLRATSNIIDSQIRDYRSVVEKLLEDMFGLKFLV